MIRSAISLKAQNILYRSRTLSAVMIAIAIPTFTAQLEKSREATDLANIRSAYAVVQASALTEDTSSQIKAHDTADVAYSKTSTGYKAVVTLHQQQAGWESGPVDVAGMTIAADAGIATATIEYIASTGATTLVLA